jgi:hypothetical protein
MAGLYLADGAWSIVKGKVIADNQLQARSVNTLEEVCREVISQLRATEQIAIDLENGVRVNFGKSLKKIPGLDATRRTDYAY